MLGLAGEEMKMEESGDILIIVCCDLVLCGESKERLRRSI